MATEHEQKVHFDGRELRCSTCLLLLQSLTCADRDTILQMKRSRLHGEARVSLGKWQLEPALCSVP